MMIHLNVYLLTYIKILANLFLLLINEQSYDAAVGDTEVVGDRYQYVDFTQPYTESGVDVSNSYKSTKVEGYRIDVFNAVMASLPIGYLVWVLEHQINKYFRHPFWHQLGMTLWFAFSAYVFSHSKPTTSF